MQPSMGGSVSTHEAVLHVAYSLVASGRACRLATPVHDFHTLLGLKTLYTPESAHPCLLEA
jgi:hypothetical protein